ncbi:nitroreductase family protein [Bacteroidales bacterium OttesenSCG-928-I21]|nr:nitroreductase family protein [Bacteroidales bacterium OttesenSCG-928-I21]
MKKKSVLIYQIACLLLLLVSVAVLAYQKHAESKNTEVSESQTALSANKDNKDALSVIFNRKSVRNYTADPVSEENVQTLIKAGMSAPSGKDIRPWEFLIVDNRDVLNTLAEELPHAKMLSHAPMAIIVCGDSARSSYWYLDCSAAAQNILLAAEALNLGAVWTAAYPYEDRMDAVAKNANLPPHVLPLCIIPVGHPNGEFMPKDKFDESKIHYDKW